MAQWTDLPENFKTELVLKLDLMSRHSLRNVSRADRLVVDSSDLYIPRVRFSIKSAAKCMIMIYTGIEKFLRIEFSRGVRGAVLIQKMENTYDLKEATTKTISGYQPIPLACSILKSLLIHDSILLGTFELEHENDDFNVQLDFMGTILKVIGVKAGKTIFRAKKFIANWMVDPRVLDIYRKALFDPKVLEEVAHDGIFLEAESMVPVKIIETNTRYELNGKLNLRQTEIWTAERELENKIRVLPMIRKTEGFVSCRLVDKRHDMIWEYQKQPSRRLNPKVEMKRALVPQIGVVSRWNKSECGIFIHIMQIKNESKYLDYFKNETCGLGWLCKKHADPFDYWFYHNLPRRVYQEPEWVDIGSLFPNMYPKDMNPKKSVQELRKRFEAEAKKMKEEKTVIQKSWGFGAQKIFEDSENSDDSENFENSEDSEHPIGVIGVQELLEEDTGKLTLRNVLKFALPLIFCILVLNYSNLFFVFFE